MERLCGALSCLCFKVQNTNVLLNYCGVTQGVISSLPAALTPVHKLWVIVPTCICKVTHFTFTKGVRMLTSCLLRSNTMYRGKLAMSSKYNLPYVGILYIHRVESFIIFSMTTDKLVSIFILFNSKKKI